jgi:large subunit ribosomal protein L30
VADRLTAGAARHVRLTLRRSLIGRPQEQRRIAWALGLRRIGASRVHVLTPGLEGALRKVQHLVVAEPVQGQGEVEHERDR